MEVSNSVHEKDGPNLESVASGIHWSSILGGAAVATAISLMLIPLGTALGFSSFSIFSVSTQSVVTLAAGGAIWLILMQWISSCVGGYIAGRLRVKWADLHSDEVFFRDTAHGFITWAVATVLSVSLMICAAVSSVGATVHEGTLTTDTASIASSHSQDETTSYYVDTLYRPFIPTAVGGNAQLNAETARILIRDEANGGVTESDKAYLTSQVALHTGLSQPSARSRVDNTVAQLDADIQKVASAAEAVRKSTVTISIILFLSLLIGAFIASASAALAGRLRDQF